jgi:nucleoside-diphosphate-sugar epimerase
MKRYLVTGGAGFIGSAIVNRLSQENCKIRVFDNEFRGSRKSLPSIKKIEFFKGDIRNFNHVLKASKEIDAIIHLAYINGTKYFYEKPDLVLEVGVKGMINVLDAARKNKVKELYLASSSEVYQTPNVIPTPEEVSYHIPDPLNPRYSYAGGKIISELLCLHLGSKFLKKVVIFRPHNVYGPRMGSEHVIPELIQKIIKLGKKSSRITLPIQGDGNQTRSFIYIDDFAEAVMLLLNKGKNKAIYNIGTQDELSILDLVKKLGDVSKTDIEIKRTKEPIGGTNRRCPDITKLKNLGFKPKTNLSNGLRKTFIWYNYYLAKDGKN